MLILHHYSRKLYIFYVIYIYIYIYILSTATDVEMLRLWEEMSATDQTDYSDDDILDQFEVSCDDHDIVY